MMEISRRSIVALAVAAFALAGCYVVPVVQDGAATHAPGPGPYALVPAGAGPVPYALAPTPVAAPGAPVPGLLQARLYPANEAATRTGMLSGTVTNRSAVGARVTETPIRAESLWRALQAAGDA